MKHVKLFESFQEKDIDSICQELGIRNWTENSDGTIDVDGDVNISYSELKKIPLKFGKVTGNFYCYNNKLTTLERAPSHVGGSFNCESNQIVTLEGAPSLVGGRFDCSSNKLITLEGAPNGFEFGLRFRFLSNPIYEVYKLFPNLKSFKDSMDYNYLRGTSIDKRRFQEALDELGIEMPDEIRGWKWI